MAGEKIMVDTFTFRGKRLGLQYDSRSDLHSKVACWCLLFDLLEHARNGPGGPYQLWQDVSDGRLGFRTNHKLIGTTLSKKLDLVVCEVAPTAPLGRHFVDIASELDIRIEDASDKALFQSLRSAKFHEVGPDHVGNARIVVEAKAAMSDLVGAMPRLYGEILASGFVARDAQDARGTPKMVMASLNLVNTSLDFLASTNGKMRHNGPGDAQRLSKMLADAFRVGLVSKAHRGQGVFDAVGITPVVCVNDRKIPVKLDRTLKVPPNARYVQMVQDICNKY